jgi:predicted metal-dependent peptidase
MKFAKVIGKCDPKLVFEAQEKLSSVFTELALGYTNKGVGGCAMGGDIFIYQLVTCQPQICLATAVEIDDLKKQEEDQDARIAKGEVIPEKEKISDEVKKIRKQLKGNLLRTAATNGKSFFWNPQFVVDKSRIGLRLLVYHEAAHAIFMHPSRRGSRHPRLWNIAVDYKVNFLGMEDLRVRGIKDYPKVFTDNLGEYITLEEYASFLKDPFNPPPRLAHFNPTLGLRKMADPAYVDPYEANPPPPMYYADHQLSDLMKRPENIYEYLLSQIPKCPKCGRLGKYKKPPEYKALQKQIAENEKKKKEEAEKAKKKAAKDAPKAKSKPSDDGHEHGDPKVSKSDPGQTCEGHSDENGEHEHGETHTHEGSEEPCNCPHPQKEEADGSCCGEDGKGCSECGNDDDSEYIDPFGGAGDTLDDHLDSDISEEELGKRISDAIDIAKKMAGQVPAGLEDELGTLIAPKITWQDIVRQQMTKKRKGFGRSDWMSPKRRPMFAGLYVPSKKDYHLTVLAAYDCSGSMSGDDIAFGLSQLQVIDEKGECFLLSWDTVCYWDDVVKINKADKENLLKAKRKGLGGTAVKEVFDYEDHLGKVDMIIIITDGFLSDGELNNIKMPPKETSVLWLTTSHNPGFKPKIGRVVHLRND